MSSQGTPAPAKSLADAIAAVEAANTALGNAGLAKSQAQAKYDAAMAAKSAASADALAGSAFNAALDDLTTPPATAPTAP